MPTTSPTVIAMAALVTTITRANCVELAEKDTTQPQPCTTEWVEATGIAHLARNDRGGDEED